MFLWGIAIFKLSEMDISRRLVRGLNVFCRKICDFVVKEVHRQHEESHDRETCCACLDINFLESNSIMSRKAWQHFTILQFLCTLKFPWDINIFEITTKNVINIIKKNYVPNQSIWCANRIASDGKNKSNVLAALSLKACDLVTGFQYKIRLINKDRLIPLVELLSPLKRVSSGFW